MSKKILITGASRGIGEAAARRFAKEGGTLVLTCEHSKERLEKLKEELEELPGVSADLFFGDVSDPAFAGLITEKHPDIDLLINNAGISHYGLLQDMTAEEWNRLLSVDLSSAFYMTKAVLPGMIARKDGQIINVSSVFGNSGASMESAYSAAKGGLNTLTKSLAKELAPSNIRVNAIAFGCIDTDMNRRLSPEERKMLEEEIPIGRFATAEEAAEALFWLSNAPSYLTGQVLLFSGGWDG